VTEPLAKVTGFPFNYRKTFTFGPKYARQISTHTLATGYLRDIEELTTASLIDRTTTFFSEAKHAFQNLATNPTSKQDFVQLNRSSQTAIEKELVASAELAFSEAMVKER